MIWTVSDNNFSIHCNGCLFSSWHVLCCFVCAGSSIGTYLPWWLCPCVSWWRGVGTGSAHKNDSGQLLVSLSYLLAFTSTLQQRPTFAFSCIITLCAVNYRGFSGSRYGCYQQKLYQVLHGNILGRIAALASCGLLLQLSSVACLLFCLSVMTVSCAEWLNRSRCHLGCGRGWIQGTVLDGGPGPLTERGMSLGFSRLPPCAVYSGPDVTIAPHVWYSAVTFLKG